MEDLTIRAKDGRRIRPFSMETVVACFAVCLGSDATGRGLVCHENVPFDLDFRTLALSSTLVSAEPCVRAEVLNEGEAADVGMGVALVTLVDPERVVEEM